MHQHEVTDSLAARQRGWDMPRGRSSSQRALLAVALTLGAVVSGAAASQAHMPSVDTGEHATPATAAALLDPTLSRAIGATIAQPGEVDWYRMDLHAGDPLVVAMTAPDAAGRVEATFVLLGPGLPAPSDADPLAAALAEQAGAQGVERFLPAAIPERQDHAGLGFLNYGEISRTATETGTYWIVVSALDPMTTGKYVLAPGVREEFTPESLGGFADMVAFFLAPWAAGNGTVPASPASPAASAP